MRVIQKVCPVCKVNLLDKESTILTRIHKDLLIMCCACFSEIVLDTREVCLDDKKANRREEFKSKMNICLTVSQKVDVLLGNRLYWNNFVHTHYKDTES